MKSTILIFLLSCLAVLGQGIVISGNSQASGNAGFGTVVPVSAGGSGAGPYTLSKSNWVVTTSATLFTTTTNLQLTSVPSGCTYTAFVKHEGSPTTISITDGTTTFTGATKIDNATGGSSGDLHSQLFYSLSPSTSGTVTFTVTFGAGVKFISIFVVAYTHGAGTPAFDGEPTGGGGQGNGTSLTSGSYTLTGNNDLTFAGFASYGNQITSEQINGVGQVNKFGRDANNCECFDRPLSATGSGVSMAATGGQGAANGWNLNFMAIR